MYIYLDIVEQFSCEMCGTCCRNDFFRIINNALVSALPGTELDCTKAAIMELELRYGHNRKLLESV